MSSVSVCACIPTLKPAFMACLHGIFIKSNFPHEHVRLTKSTDYFSNHPSPMVSGAKVVVSDGTNEYVFAENDSLGYYKAPMLFEAFYLPFVVAEVSKSTL